LSHGLYPWDSHHRPCGPFAFRRAMVFLPEALSLRSGFLRVAGLEPLHPCPADFFLFMNQIHILLEVALPFPLRRFLGDRIRYYPLLPCYRDNAFGTLPYSWNLAARPCGKLTCPLLGSPLAGLGAAAPGFSHSAIVRPRRCVLPGLLPPPTGRRWKVCSPRGDYGVDRTRPVSLSEKDPPFQEY
jgi:hypothetical protein